MDMTAASSCPGRVPVSTVFLWGPKAPGAHGGHGAPFQGPPGPCRSQPRVRWLLCVRFLEEVGAPEEFLIQKARDWSQEEVRS